MSLLSGVPEKDRGAKFVSVVCCAFPNGDVISARGECLGRIGFERRGSGGFGYDPVFYVGDKSFSELLPEEKDALSHRSAALKNLAEKLSEYYA